MTRITQADQIMQLLRQQLQRLGPNGHAARASRTGKSAPQRQSPLTRIAAMAALDNLSDDDLARALIRALLTEEFGETLASEPKFARIVDEVHRMISEDTETARLLVRSLSQVKDMRPHPPGNAG